MTMRMHGEPVPDQIEGILDPNRPLFTMIDDLHDLRDG